MLEKHDIVCGILAGSGWSSDPSLPPAERVQKQFDALNHVLADLDRKERFLDQTLALLKAFALAGATDATIAIRNDVQPAAIRADRHSREAGEGYLNPANECSGSGVDDEEALPGQDVRKRPVRGEHDLRRCLGVGIRSLRQLHRRSHRQRIRVDDADAARAGRSHNAPLNSHRTDPSRERDRRHEPWLPWTRHDRRGGPAITEGHSDGQCRRNDDAPSRSPCGVHSHEPQCNGGSTHHLRAKNPLAGRWLNWVATTPSSNCARTPGHRG